MNPEFDDFTPSRILLPAQLRSLRKLHDIADRSYQEMRVDGGLRVPRNGDVDWTRWRAEVAHAEEETMAVVRKSLGIGRYSVLHLIREGGYESWFQLRSVKLMRDFAFSTEAWHFEGGMLKKDKSIGAGSRHGGMGFKIAFMERRRLDGRWERVRPAYR